MLPLSSSSIVELNLSHNDIQSGGAGFLANWISALNQPGTHFLETLLFIRWKARVPSKAILSKY